MRVVTMILFRIKGFPVQLGRQQGWLEQFLNLSRMRRSAFRHLHEIQVFAEIVERVGRCRCDLDAALLLSVLEDRLGSVNSPGITPDVFPKRR